MAWTAWYLMARVRWFKQLLTFYPSWRHQMEAFSVLLALCEGNLPEDSPHKGQWFEALMFLLWSGPEKSLSKQSKRRWCETPRCSLWCHCNAMKPTGIHWNEKDLKNTFHKTLCIVPFEMEDIWTLLLETCARHIMCWWNGSSGV